MTSYKCKYLRVKTHMGGRDPTFHCIMRHSTQDPALGESGKCYKKGGCKHGRYIEQKPKTST